MLRRRILIVGGSTRAAADSVRRAGWNPVCADLFADLDLRNTAEVIAVRSYPDSLPEDIAEVRADGWFYTGALENRPDLVACLTASESRIGPLLGNAPNALKLVRDPLWLMTTLRTAGIAALEVALSSSPPKPDGTWLQKPLASAGGRAIRIWNEMTQNDPWQEPHYFQQHVSGLGVSAVFRFEQNTVEYLGASRGIPRDSLFRAPGEFCYRGSWGPFKETATFDHEIQRQFESIARTLAKNVPGLCGLVGLDALFNSGIVWLLEVNPRYTASIEVLELASGRSILNPQSFNSSRSNEPRIVAKQILYSESSFKAPDLEYLKTDLDPWTVPIIADVPVPQTNINPGDPICTILAVGTTEDSVFANLHNRIHQVSAAIRCQQIER